MMLGGNCLKYQRKYRHNISLLRQISDASGLSVEGIKNLSIELCGELDIDWPLKWRRFGQQG